MEILEKFRKVRNRTEELCKPLITEDYSVQPKDFTSPPKWHLAHSTWFWEEFLLTKYVPNYKVLHKEFSFLFNSYYNNVGSRVLRPNRGLITRPSVSEVLEYRNFVTQAMIDFIKDDPNNEVFKIIEIGINHEEQHQELLIYDIKYILGHQTSFPKYGEGFDTKEIHQKDEWLKVKSGIYEIGHIGNSFCFDNELGRHKVYLEEFEISKTLITNAQYIEFIEAGGYEDFNYWHDEGWNWVTENKIEAPLYWHKIDNDWYQYTF